MSRKRNKRRASRKAKGGVFGGKVKRFGKKVGGKVKSGAKKVIDKAKKGGFILLLKPYEFLMKKVLKKRGVKAPNNLVDLAKTFFSEIVRKDHYDEHSHFGGDSPSVYNPNLEYDEIDCSRDNIDPVTVSAIVSAVVKWIKGQMNKKRNNEPMTPTQQTAADIGEKVELQYREERRTAIDGEIGNLLTDYWWVAVIALFLFMKK